MSVAASTRPGAMTEGWPGGGGRSKSLATSSLVVGVLVGVLVGGRNCG